MNNTYKKMDGYLASHCSLHPPASSSAASDAFKQAVKKKHMFQFNDDFEIQRAFNKMKGYIANYSINQLKGPKYNLLS